MPMVVGMIVPVSGMVVTGAVPVVVPLGMGRMGAGDGWRGGQGRDGSGLVEWEVI